MSTYNANKLLKALIHSPFHIQVTTTTGIDLAEVSVQKKLSITQLKASIDETAYRLMPDDMPSNVYTDCKPSFPIIIQGDGNCLARVGSVLMHGAETHHPDVRLRIAVEMILFKDLYLDEDHLSKGLPHGQRLTAAMVAQFSDSYTFQHLDAKGVENIYLKEVHQVLKCGEYMGTWQLFALASVLRTPIFSAYPKLGNPNVRKDLHRIIMPRNMRAPNPIHVVLWSSCRQDMVPSNWVPNHFTVVLPISV